MVQLPYHFPDPLEDAAQRAEEFQRFTPERRLREIAAMMEFGLAMMQASPRRDWIEQRFAEQEAQWQQCQQQLFASHE